MQDDVKCFVSSVNKVYLIFYGCCLIGIKCSRTTGLWNWKYILSNFKLVTIHSQVLLILFSTLQFETLRCFLHLIRDTGDRVNDKMSGKYGHCSSMFNKVQARNIALEILFCKFRLLTQISYKAYNILLSFINAGGDIDIHV